DGHGHSRSPGAGRLSTYRRNTELKQTREGYSEQEIWPMMRRQIVPLVRPELLPGARPTGYRERAKIRVTCQVARFQEIEEITQGKGNTKQQQLAAQLGH